MKREDIFKRLVEHKKILESKGYTVLYIGLYGSQNYNLSDSNSDIDTKAIILPTLKDIIFRNPTSKTVECENGNIDVKDLITFYDVIKKGNFSYIESINTEYSIGEKEIKEMFKVFKVNFKSILGAMYEKRKALDHKYPSKEEEFEKWGCDPKQTHHIIRLYDILEYNLLNNSCVSFLEYEEEKAQEMIDIKRNNKGLSLEYLATISDDYINRARELIDYNYSFEVINIDDKINEYIENAIKLQLINKKEVVYARQYRTFGGPIPTADKKKFPKVLEPLDGQDISYIVYESIEVI